MRPRLLVAVTDPVSCLLLQGQLAYARARGFETALLCSPGERAEQLARSEAVSLFRVPMQRHVSPWRDLVALVGICRAIGNFRPDIVNAGTPKAGLLVTLAAWLCRVPCRIYTMRGLYLETSSGMRRRLLFAVEWVTCRLADRVVCVSRSLMAGATACGVVPASRARVLGQGSSNGIDLARFSRTPGVDAAAELVRAAAVIPPDAVVIGFVGRLARDKGVRELLDGWRQIRDEFPSTHLLLVGLPEDEAVSALLREVMDADARVYLARSVAFPEHYYAAMDLLLLPTYREGLPNVLLESGAMEVPAVATRVTGCVDVIEHGVTGTLIAARDAAALAGAVRRYLDDPGLRRRHGRAARERVARDYAREHVWARLNEEYAGLLAERQRPLPLPLSDHVAIAPTAVGTPS